MKSIKFIIPLISVVLLVSILTACGAEENGAVLPVNPVNSEKTAGKMSDGDLIDLLQNELFSNIRIVEDFVCTGGKLQRESDVTYDSGGSGAEYQLISNVKDKSALERCVNNVFTGEYSKSAVFPVMFDGEPPLFVEADGRLYNNANTGGALAY